MQHVSMIVFLNLEESTSLPTYNMWENNTTVLQVNAVFTDSGFSWIFTYFRCSTIFFLDINILFGHSQHVLCNQRYCAQAFFVPCSLQSVKYILSETNKQAHYGHVLLRCSYPTYVETFVAFDFFYCFRQRNEEARKKNEKKKLWSATEFNGLLFLFYSCYKNGICMSYTI